LEEEHWVGQDLSAFEGFFVLGFPENLHGSSFAFGPKAVPRDQDAAAVDAISGEELFQDAAHVCGRKRSIRRAVVEQMRGNDAGKAVGTGGCI
jgi:hypothetical protein